MKLQKPADDQRVDEIKRQIAELQAQLAEAGGSAVTAATASAAVQPTEHTGGGAVFKKAVTAKQGHVIGRDFVQVIESMVVQGEDPQHAVLALGSYLQALSADLAGLKLGDIDASPDQTRQDPLQLADIYVPLNTTFQLAKRATLAKALRLQHDAGAAPGHRIGARDEDRGFRHASAIEALAHHRCLTLLGAPGSGKSTFGAHVLLSLAQAWQGRAKAEKLLGKNWSAGALLPVRVVLRQFAERHAASNKTLRAGDLWAFIGQDLQDAGWSSNAAALQVVQRVAREHGALVLFDGLDECGDETRRQRVLAAVQEFMQTAGDRSRFLLTARPYAFPAGADARQAVYQLAELDENQTAQFIKAWYRALVKKGWQKQNTADAKCSDLLGAHQRADLQPLARNPLLLTLMATLHSNRGRLPDDRVDLYDDTISLLLERWNKDVGGDRALLAALNMPGLTLRHLRITLEKLAFEVHEANEGSEGVADIGETRLLRAFSHDLGGSLDKAKQVVAFIERRAGLLLGLGAREAHDEPQFSFPHRTFQEFLAACHLHRMAGFGVACRRLASRAPGHWQEVLPLAARLAQAERGAAAADEVIGACLPDMGTLAVCPGPEHWSRAHIAGLMLKELGLVQLNQAHTSLAVAQRVRSWLAAGLPLHPSGGGLPAGFRAAMGHTLAALGDPRFDAQRLHLPAEPMLGFVAIAADPAFCIGTRAALRQHTQDVTGSAIDDEEINDNLSPTPAFHIGRYAVTVAQFRAYVLASGAIPEDADALRGSDNHPVVRVSFKEAVAYCAWLQDRLLHDPALQNWHLRAALEQGLIQVSLPSELEWEKAARGGLVDQVFSWGDEPDPERANCANTGPLSTMAVGSFLANGSGLHDMLGNVWEWTRSLRHSVEGGATNAYPPTADQRPFVVLYADDDIDRLVRGGAWVNIRDRARCACRGQGRPSGRGGGLGFRVVLSSSAVL